MKNNKQIGHDLKQPLTTLRTFIRHLENRKDDPAFMAEFLNHVPKALDRIEQIANELSRETEW